MSAEDRPINEELHVPAEQGIFGGQSIFATDSGITTLVLTAFCDRCHSLLNGEYISCACGRKICSRCKIFYEIENVFLCLECVQQRLFLSKEMFTVLSGFAHLSNSRDVSKLARLDTDEGRRLVQGLLSAGFIVRKGVRPFSKYELTYAGSVALAIYSQAFGTHQDISDFISRLREKKELENNGTR